MDSLSIHRIDIQILSMNVIKARHNPKETCKYSINLIDRRKSKSLNTASKLRRRAKSNISFREFNRIGPKVKVGYFFQRVQQNRSRKSWIKQREVQISVLLKMSQSISHSLKRRWRQRCLVQTHENIKMIKIVDSRIQNLLVSNTVTSSKNSLISNLERKQWKSQTMKKSQFRIWKVHIKNLVTQQEEEEERS